MAAGSGVEHSEFNHSETEPVHLLQIWIVPDRKGTKPAYAERSFVKAATGHLNLVASKMARDGSIAINQDADVFLAKLATGESVKHHLLPHRHAWVQIAEGEVTLNGHPLKAGDGAALSSEENIELLGTRPSQVMIFDLN